MNVNSLLNPLRPTNQPPHCEVVYRPLDELKRHPANPRRHSKKQIRQIAESIKTFVFKYGRHGHRNNVQLGRFGRNRSNVWHYPGANSFARDGAEGNLSALHPTVKPVAMIADAILDCSARGEIVLDGFLGSGTTVIAAERIGRRCYGLELDPAYVDTIIRRWQGLTGGSAYHAASSRGFDDLAQEAEAANAG